MVTSVLTSRGQTLKRNRSTLPANSSFKYPLETRQQVLYFWDKLCSDKSLFSSLLHVQNEHLQLSLVTIWHFGSDWQSSWQETGSNLQQNSLKITAVSTLWVYLLDTLGLRYTMPFACLNTQHNSCDVLEVSSKSKKP